MMQRLGLAGLVVLAGQASGQFSFTGDDQGRPFTYEFIAPASIFPGAGFRAGIEDAQIDGQTNAWDGFGLVRVNGNAVAAGSFDGSPANNQGLYSFTQPLGGNLSVVSSYRFVGNIPFIRQEIKLINRSDAPVTFTVEVEGNVGADGQQAMFGSSSGDAGFGINDFWVVGDEFNASSSGAPATGFVFGGLGAEITPTTVSDLTSYSSGGIEGYRVVHEVTVDPFDDRILAYFWEIDTTAALLVSGIQIYNLPDLLEALAYFDPQEFGDDGRHANFDRLETWDGTVSGSLLQPAGWQYGSLPTGEGAEVSGDRSAFLPAGERLDVDAFVMDQSSVEIQQGAMLGVDGRFVIDGTSELVLNGGVLSPGYIVINNGLLAARGLGNRIENNGTSFPSLRNTSDFEIVGAPFAADFASITVDDQVLNLDQIILRGGSELRAEEGIRNEANLDIVFANASVDGDISNDSAAVVSVSGGSLFNQVGDLTNDGTFILSTDSSYSLLGSLVGNGIEGPGGPGTAGTVFIRDGVGGRSGGTNRIGFDGPLSLGSNATTTIRLGGEVAGVDFDQIVVADTFNAAGTIRFESVNGFVPQAGDVFDVLEFGSVQGSFSSIEFDATLAGLGFDTSDLLVDGTIRIPDDCRADTNGDGLVSPADFNAWILAFNSQAPACDQNGDNLCTPADFNAWILNFNAGCD